MSPKLAIQLDATCPGWPERLSWHGDNRKFVIECVIPLMTLDPDIRQVIRWAYGYDGEDRSIEAWSDGSTGVKNRFFDGRAKDPHGVGHDYLHRLSHLHIADPSRHIWTFRKAADWYKRASIQFGDPPLWAIAKRIGLDLFAWPLWGPRRQKQQENSHVE